MIIVNSGNTNTVTYYSRYNQIDKYEIFDHNSRLVNSGLTTLVGSGGKIVHSGITYPFILNNQYTYKAYFYYNTVYYLSTQQYIVSYKNETQLDTFKQVVKEKNTFITNGK